MLTTRLRATTVGAAIAIIAVAAPGASVGAAASSACTASSGVTVIVDFSHFAGRGIERGCAPGHPATALAALHAAGFSTSGTAQYGDAFVCRIDGLPSAQHEACDKTPPGNASWSFYYGKPTDGKWTYSNTGVVGYQPLRGSIEAFAFGNFAEPGVSPSAALPPATTTTPPTAPPTPAPTTTVPAPPVSAAIVATTTGVPPTTSAAASTSTSTSTTGTAATTTSSSHASATVLFVQRARKAPLPRDHSGSPFPAILTIVVVGALAIGAAAISRARRRRPA